MTPRFVICAVAALGFALPAQSQVVLGRSALPAAPAVVPLPAGLAGAPLLVPLSSLSTLSAGLPSLAPISPTIAPVPTIASVRALSGAASRREAAVERSRGLIRRIDNTPGRAADLLGGFFDGKRFFSKGIPVSEAPAAFDAPPGQGWIEGRFDSSDGTGLVFHRRGPAATGRAPRIFVGGLALAQSFDAHFAKGPAPERLEYRANLRGLPPSGWSPTTSVIDADARDLARLINLAARETGSARVELALHSYAGLVLQRMVQMGGEPEIAEALSRLSGARVTMFGPTTHVPGSEALMGPSMEALAFGLRRFVAMIDAGDAYVVRWNSLAKWNPFVAPYAGALEASWTMQRRTAIAFAVGDIERMLKADLNEPWPGEIEPLRRRFLAEVEEAARTTDWQEAALRRVRDGFELDFDDASAAALRALGAKIRVVYSHDDALIPWRVEKLLLGKLGIETPAELPAAGTVLRGPDGIEAVIAAGDHYLPLIRYGLLPEHFER